MPNDAVSKSSPDTSKAMVELTGVNGKTIPALTATWNATRHVVDSYYADYFEIAKGITSNSDAEIKVNNRPVPLQIVVHGVHSIAVIVSTAYEYLKGGGAYRLATFVGPIIGHMKAVKSVMVPQILSAQEPLNEKSTKLDKLQTGLTELSGQITILDRDAYAWKALSPKSAYDLAVKCVNEAIRQIMKEVFAFIDLSKKFAKASITAADKDEPSEASSSSKVNTHIGGNAERGI